MLTRRIVLLGGAASLSVLAGCSGGGGPATLTVSAQGGTGMNPGPDGTDRPLTVQVMQMSGTGAFEAADFFALQDPQSALGPEFLSVQQIVLAPGGGATTVAIPVQAGATAIGFVAGFRDPAGKTFRQTIAPPTVDEGILVAVGANGITLTEV